MRRCALLIVLTTCLGGCDDFPRDSQGTLERVRAGEPLRVGWVPAEPWVRRTGTGEPAGLEPDLIRAWAETIPAQIEWISGSETQLVKALQENTIDVAVAGFTADSPWGGRIGQTQGYLKVAVAVGAAPGHRVPADWHGLEIRYDRGRPDLAAAIKGIGAIPVPADPPQLGPIAAAYAPELMALGLAPTGETLTTGRRVIATAPAENALTLALDRFLHARRDEIEKRLTAEAHL